MHYEITETENGSWRLTMDGETSCHATRAEAERAAREYAELMNADL